MNRPGFSPVAVTAVYRVSADRMGGVLLEKLPCGRSLYLQPGDDGSGLLEELATVRSEDPQADARQVNALLSDYDSNLEA